MSVEKEPYLATQWLYLDNLKHGWPPHFYMEHEKFLAAEKWAKAKGFTVDGRRLTDDGLVFFLLNYNAKVENA